jgi:enolase
LASNTILSLSPQVFLKRETRFCTEVCVVHARISHVPLYEHFARLYHGDSMPSKFTIPTPLVNILNGGKHAGGKLKIQEFMIVPTEGIKFRDALRQVTEVYHRLGVVLREKYGVSARNVGDEGGYAPLIDTAHDALIAVFA